MLNRIKSTFRLPRTGRGIITYKGWQRPYIRNIYGKLYLAVLRSGSSRAGAEKIAKGRYKDYIIVPSAMKGKSYKGLKGVKHRVAPNSYNIYVEADEFIRLKKQGKE